MAYNRQLFLNVLDGDGDGVITSGTQRIAKKGLLKYIPYSIRRYPKAPNIPGDGPLITEDIAAAISPWRLYIRGHGDWQMKTIAGVKPTEIAANLSVWGLAANVPAVLSITGCSAAKGQSEPANQKSLQISTNSFVAEFHRALKLSHGIETVVYGRTEDLATAGSGAKVTQVRYTGKMVYHQQFSKVKFSWDAANQVTEWVHYDDPMEVDDPMDVELPPVSEPMTLG